MNADLMLSDCQPIFGPCIILLSVQKLESNLHFQHHTYMVQQYLNIIQTKYMYLQTLWTSHKQNLDIASLKTVDQLKNLLENMSVPILQTKKEVCLEPLSCSVPTNFPEREFQETKSISILIFKILITKPLKGL